ncbi:hypothetical protein SEA_STARBOW_203 [Streptomyces phage Starbow]|uniref:Uncharacterized protein n=1 Tax=Streptomyces phage Starbow TaxID=2283266 RepID=A0A345M850_9CAUD|nr:hypothetical protein SEA_STARBOW_203 [Streptomyces phage Starbow]
MSNYAREKAQRAVKQSKCVTINSFVGCGKDVDIDKDFRDSNSRSEYRISGLCQSCQDKLYSD